MTARGLSYCRRVSVSLHTRWLSGGSQPPDAGYTPRMAPDRASTDARWRVLGRRALTGLTVAVVAYLAAVALWPSILDRLPSALAWFGQPNSAISILIALVLVLSLTYVFTRGRGNTGAPIAVVAGLAGLSALLGMASFIRCHAPDQPFFFTAVIWTAKLMRGDFPDGAAKCLHATPVAVYVAQLTALTAVVLSVVGVAATLLRSRFDRLRAFFARSVTAVVGIDDDSAPLIAAIAAARPRRSTLVVITGSPDRPCIGQARAQGARVVTVDFARTETWASLSLFRKLDALYLLDANATLNLARLDVLSEVGDTHGRKRLPVVVRIDDPWQASAWRAEQFDRARSETVATSDRWALDTVGLYEVTARKLVDQIIDADVDRVLICGTSRLTLALCAELAARQLDADYRGGHELPAAVVVDQGADDLVADHRRSRSELGLPADRPLITAVDAEPTVATLADLVDDATADRTAIVLVDADLDPTLATRVALRYPRTPTFAHTATHEAGTAPIGYSSARPVVGKLRMFETTMEIPDGQAHDSWELAARSIHERYDAEHPWSSLDEFYRESNRRQVANALWIVETHSDCTWRGTDDGRTWTPPDKSETAPLAQLAALGFDEPTALRMAQAEHEDWCRFYRANGWTHGTRDDAAKRHDFLLDWDEIAADPERRGRALTSLAVTLTKLRELGYQTAPKDSDA
ncbi:MAG: hypothetical protein QM728_05540 [Gordonia sp. (in: high G+C Gram-positive bacteria)]|uniref:hypothetical protein n=1 Tax=Gordonia sp. (in: high G+C Gram-positive bacteria) TaxID=84139 RepID=UPI0039E3EAE3